MYKGHPLRRKIIARRTDFPVNDGIIIWINRIPADAYLKFLGREGRSFFKVGLHSKSLLFRPFKITYSVQFCIMPFFNMHSGFFPWIHQEIRNSRRDHQNHQRRSGSCFPRAVLLGKRFAIELNKHF